MKNLVMCPKCNGDGWTSEHANHPHPDGDCCGECPVQSQCPYCEATGEIDVKELKRRELIELETKNDSNSELPF